MDRTKSYLASKIPNNKPYLTDKELAYISYAHQRGQLSGDGYFTKKCHAWIEKNFQVKKALLTHSCTAALEMMGILANISPGDEVIMPSFTFSSTANAIVLRGGIPVFVDIRNDTLNLNEKLIEQAITKKTRAIFVVHYAGVGCEMDSIMRIAKKYHLLVFEDAAQGFLATYKGRYLGTIGDMGAYSFHETKNIISGEGGSLLINNKAYIERAEIIREKGTNRSKFYRGEVDKYTWVDVGSSYLPGEIVAAFLFAQFEVSKKIIKKRRLLWGTYRSLLLTLEKTGVVRLPYVPEYCEHNGHIFYMLIDSNKTRNDLIRYLKEKGILAIFHYIPLHSSPAGKNFGRANGSMEITDSVADSLIRLPLFYDLQKSEVEYICLQIATFFGIKI